LTAELPKAGIKGKIVDREKVVGLLKEKWK
jgi:hypothetical protein